MSYKPETTHTTKPCVCNVIKRGRLVWKVTGRKNSENQSEYQCKFCGAIAWR
jgi:hypothetical protein